MKPNYQHRSSGFTLVELLVTLAAVATLAAAAMAGLTSARAKAVDVTDLARMRGLGVAIYSWATDHQGKPPRSSHSANGHGELGWQREILPHLGYDDTSRETLQKAKPGQFGIDPKETPSRTPALNVYFELNPEYDDYEGAPKTWRNFMAVPQPSATLLLIMAFGSSDHVMAQYFSGSAADFPAPRKDRKKGCVLWVDGHVSLEMSGSMFDPTKGIDHFHPEKVR